MMKHVEKINELYGPPLSLQELCDNVFYYANKYYLKERELLGWGMLVGFNEEICNTHYAPHNGKTNWHWSRSLTKGYPGWIGRVWMFYDGQSRIGSNDDNLFSNLRLYTGSGGAGLCNCPFYSYSKMGSLVYPLGYDFRFFQADWPSLILGHVLNEENKNRQLVYKMRGDLIEKIK